MDSLLFDWSALGNMALGAVFLYAGKRVWQRWGARESRVTPEGCALKYATMSNNMLAQWNAYKLEIKNQMVIQDNRMKCGDDSFTHLNIRMDRTNTLLEAMITIQMKLCENVPNIDCEDLTRLLIKQGIDIDSLKTRLKNGQ